MKFSESRLCGPDGRPLARRADLRREAGRPEYGGIRQPWMLDAVAPGLTPAALKAVIDAADSGNTRPFITLASELEERFPRYGACLGARKLAVLGIEARVILPKGAPASAQALADEVHDEIVAQPSFRDACTGCLDGLGKGWAAVEIVWAKSSERWTPAEYRWRDQRYFRWNREDPAELRMLDRADPADGIPLERGKWLVHVPALRAGIPARNGLARVAAALYCLAAWAVTDWMSFLETYGQPSRIGKYHSSASEDDKRALMDAVVQLGSNAAGIFPDSMQMDLLAAASSSGTDAYERACRWLDEQVTIAVLGQSASTQGTPGRLGGDELQGEVRHDITAADSWDLAQTLNRDLIRPYVEFNHGRAEHCPLLEIAPDDVEDALALARVAAMMVPLGMQVDSRALAGRLGLPVAGEGAEALAPVASRRAMARAVAAALRDGSGLRDIREHLADSWEPAMEPLRKALSEALSGAGESPEGIARALAALAGEEGPEEPLARELAGALIAARAEGFGRA